MWARVVIGVVAIAVGVVWFFQGLGVIKGSFMTGEVVWSVFGLFAFFIGAALLDGARRARRRH